MAPAPRKFRGRLIIWAFPLLLILGCDHELKTPQTGDYTGTFRARYHVVMQNQTYDTVISGPVTLSLSGNQFECSSNRNYYPGGGSGVFSVQGDSIDFGPLGFHTMDHDPNSHLFDHYGFKATKKSLQLTRKVPNWVTLEYDLLLD